MKTFALGARAVEMPIPRPASKAVAGGDIALEVPATRKPRRRMFRALNHGVVPGYAPISVDTNDVDTIRCGLEQRLCRDLPPVNQTILAEFKQFVGKWCDENVPAVAVPTFESWLEDTGYNEARKRELRVAYESLKGGRPSRKEASKLQTFGKTQAYPKYAHCRIINARNDKVKVFFGPRFKAIEKFIYDLPAFIKHTPTADRPAKIASLVRAGRRYFLTDYTAFESHFIAEVMDACECVLYRHCLRNDPHAEFLCSVLTGVNRLTTRSKVRCRLQARRMSGEMCTSLGNGFTNYMLTLFLAQRAGGDVEGFVEGDDGIFAATCNLTAEMYAEMGFTIKIAEVEDPCTAVPRFAIDSRYGCNVGAFCGVMCTQAGEIVRDPRVFASKFGWTSSFLNAGDKIMAELARAHAMSALAEAPQCPIVGAMARRVLADTMGHKARFVDDGYHKPVERFVCPDYAPAPETRELFARLFGVSVPEQLEAERLLAAGCFDIAHLMPPTPDCAHYAARYVETT